MGLYIISLLAHYLQFGKRFYLHASQKAIRNEGNRHITSTRGEKIASSLTGHCAIFLPHILGLVPCKKKKSSLRLATAFVVCVLQEERRKTRTPQKRKKNNFVFPPCWSARIASFLFVLARGRLFYFTHFLPFSLSLPS